MSTTYVLHGGATSKDLSDNIFFFRQFTELVDKDEVNILMCYWSRPKEQWEELVQRDTEKVEQNSLKKTTFSIVQDASDLYQRLDTADVLYVAGGDDKLIEPYLPKLKDLRERLNGKIYLGSSMGAFIVSSNYVLSFDSQDTKTVHHGLGLIPIQTLCHWDIENKKGMKIQLLQRESKLPIVTLNEG